MAQRAETEPSPLPVLTAPVIHLPEKAGAVARARTPGRINTQAAQAAAILTQLQPRAGAEPEALFLVAPEQPGPTTPEILRYGADSAVVAAQAIRMQHLLAALAALAAILAAAVVAVDRPSLATRERAARAARARW